MLARSLRRALVGVGLATAALAALSAPLLAQPLPDASAAAPDSSATVPDTARVAWDLPARTVAGLVGWQPGVARLGASDDLLVRGRPLSTFYLDGLAARGLPSLPQAHLDGVRVYTDVVPARYGGATAGLVEVETPALVAAPFAQAEGYTSEGIDAYGHSLAAFSAGAPLLRDRLSFTLAGELRRFDDGDPRSGGFVQLTEDAATRVGDAVQVVLGFEEDGQARPVFVPESLLGMSADEARAQLGVGEGPFLYPSWVALGEDDLETVAANPAGGAEATWLSGGVYARLGAGTDLRLRGQVVRDERRLADYWSTLYTAASIPQRDAGTWRLQASLDQRVSPRLALHASAALDHTATTTYDPRFGDDVRAALFYGDLDDPRNALGARYATVDATGQLVQRYDDGALSPSRAAGIFALPGTMTTTFEQTEQQQQALRLAATLGLDAHDLEVGLEAVQQTLRLYRWERADHLARFYADGDVERGADNAITAYDQIDFRDAGVLAATRYYGYDYLGLNEVDDQRVEPLLEGADPAYAVAPLQPRRFGLYADDETALGPVRLRLGLRFDVFDENRLALYDPYALVPVYRVGDFEGGDLVTDDGSLLARFPEGGVPSDLGDDFALYTNNSGEVVGYRSLSGQFYDAAGEPVDDPAEVTTQFGGQAVRTGGSTAEALVETERRAAVSPRVEARMDVAEGLEARAFFAQYAEAPDPTLAATPLDVLRLTRTSVANVPVALSTLRPIRAETYGLGATFAPDLGALALAASATVFRRHYWDLPVLRVVDAFPAAYTGLRSEGTASVTGVEVVARAARGPFGADVHYTYLHEQESGSTSPQMVFRATLRSPDFGVRPHSLHLVARYATDPGDAVLGQRWLGGLRASVAGRYLSGQAYWLLDTDGFTPLIGDGSTPDLDRRTDALVRMDLHLEKAFRLGGVEAAAYLWVENVLGTENVLAVYQTTGEPDDDGYLTSAHGEQELNQFDTDLEREAFIAHYRAGLRTPYNYARPRQVRLGLRVGF